VYFRKLRPRPLKALSTLAASAAVFGAVMLTCVALNPLLSPVAGNPLLSLTLDPRLVQGLKVTLRDTQGDGAAFSAGRTPTLLAIQNSGVLRVGYNPNVIPFSYRNIRGDLVGYDIAFAYRLARDLNVTLELVPFDWQGLSGDLARQRFDLAMAGAYITDEQLKTLKVSHSYYQSPVALIVRSDRAPDFLERNAIIAMPHLRLAVFDDPVLVPMVRRLFPGAAIEVVPDYSVLPEMTDRIDGAIWTLEQAGPWAAAHPASLPSRPPTWAPRSCSPTCCRQTPTVFASTSISGSSSRPATAFALRSSITGSRASGGRSGGRAGTCSTRCCPRRTAEARCLKSASQPATYSHIGLRIAANLGSGVSRCRDRNGRSTNTASAITKRFHDRRQDED
jgi:ABC-type amino acid transport substrate-binding protein